MIILFNLDDNIITEDFKSLIIKILNSERGKLI